MKKKWMYTALAAAALTAAMNMQAFAGRWYEPSDTAPGWRHGNITLTDTGTVSELDTNGWYWIDGNNDGISECYYFGPDAYLLTNTVTPDGYTVDANGAWTVDGIVQTKVTRQPVGSMFYNEAGISKAALDMLSSTRAGNAGKYGVSMQVGFESASSSGSVIYNNQFYALYRTAEEQASPVFLEYYGNGSHAELFAPIEGLPSTAREAYAYLQQKGYDVELFSDYSTWGQLAIYFNDCTIVLERDYQGLGWYGGAWGAQLYKK